MSQYIPWKESMPTCKLLSLAYSACLHLDSHLQFRLTSGKHIALIPVKAE